MPCFWSACPSSASQTLTPAVMKNHNATLPHLCDDAPHLP
jgi:hypothetical protein